MPSAVFTTGGTVQAGSGVYIPRRADKELLDLCLNGKYAYILAARQVGKSSLMVNVSRTLAQQGIDSAIVDLSAVGKAEVTAEGWYLAILATIERRLAMRDDAEEWWEKYGKRTYSEGLLVTFGSRYCRRRAEGWLSFLTKSTRHWG